MKKWRSQKRFLEIKQKELEELRETFKQAEAVLSDLGCLDIVELISEAIVKIDFEINSTGGK